MARIKDGRNEQVTYLGHTVAIISLGDELALKTSLGYFVYITIDDIENAQKCIKQANAGEGITVNIT